MTLPPVRAPKGIKYAPGQMHVMSRIASEALALAESSQFSASWRSPRIVILDDETAVRRGLANVLRQWYADPCIVELDNGDDALKEIHRATPDLFMTDLNHLGCSHLGLLEVLAQRGVQFPVLVISGKVSGYLAELGRLAAVINLSYVQKPCEARELYDRISNLLPQFPVHTIDSGSTLDEH